MKAMTADRIAMLVGTAALTLLAGALGFQYIGHLAPCEMCHWQRWAHIAAGVFGLGGGFCMARGNMPRNDIVAWLAIVCVTLSGAIALYQAGMQAHILPGPSSCTGHRFVLGSHETPQVQCDVVTWTLFGLSLAVYNAIASFAIAAAGTFWMGKRTA